MSARASAWIATLGGVGHLRPAPGTWGSLAGCALALATFAALGWPGFVVALAVIVALGTWAIQDQSRDSQTHDAAQWVIDEVAGQWIALLPVAYGAYFAQVPIIRLWPGWLVAFAAFRLFDITKPWLVGRADRKSTPFSVMEDDLWAGAFAAVVVSALGAFAHLVLM